MAKLFTLVVRVFTEFLKSFPPKDRKVVIFMLILLICGQLDQSMEVAMRLLVG